MIIGIFKEKGKFLKLTLVTLTFALLFSSFYPTLSTSAGPDNLSFKMTNGGKWEYEGKVDTDYVKKMGWTGNDWRAIEIVRKMEFIPPDMVQIMVNDLAKDIGADMSNEIIKWGVDAAVASGISSAKKSLITKYGAVQAAKVIPYLSFFAWSYTAYDVFSTIAKGQRLEFLAEAASKKTGVIYKDAGSTGDSSDWYFWDGSSRYGKYPNAILNPNKYQFGKVTVNP